MEYNNLMTPKQKAKTKENMKELIKIKEMKPFTDRVLSFIEIYRRIMEIEIKFFHPNLNKGERDTLLYEYIALTGSLNGMLPNYSYPKKKGVS